jgi:hypothetical protein
VGLSIGLDDVAVMGETIEERGRHLASPKTVGHLFLVLKFAEPNHL